MQNNTLAIIFLIMGLALVIPPPAAHAQRSALGFFDGRGEIGVEDEEGESHQIEARPSVRYKQWLDEESAIELSARMQSAVAANLQFSAFYLHHYPRQNVFPYFGGGLIWADSIVDDEEDLIAAGLPVGIEWDFEDNPFALNIHATNAFILDPESDISIAQRIDFGLYYYF